MSSERYPNPLERYPNPLKLPYRSLCVEHEHMPNSTPYQSGETVNLSKFCEKSKSLASSYPAVVRQRGDILPVEYPERAKARSNE
jgi:hypothetical protein